MSGDFKVPNLVRGLKIIELLVEQQGPISLSEIAKDLELPNNSTMRIMNALEHYGYVLRDSGSKKYTISRKLLSLASRMPKEKTLIENCYESMRNIRDQFGETVVLTVMDHKEGVVVEQLQGTHHFRFVVELGSKQGLHISASTKALLMNANDEELQELFDDYDFKIYTPTTLKNLKEYKSDLQEARRRGYALDCAEHIEGVHCAAAPVYNHKGQTIASITVTGPSFRMSEKNLAEAGTIVRQEALKASIKMGFQHITEEAVS